MCPGSSNKTGNEEKIMELDQDEDAAAQSGRGESLPLALSGNSEYPPQCARHVVWSHRSSREPKFPGESLQVIRRSVNPKARARLNRELTQITEDPPAGCHVERVGDNLFEWQATIGGPKNTPYEGGIFKLQLCFPLSYPFMPPQVSFQTRIYHCNVNAAGKINLDSLDKNWSPVLKVANLLLSITSLLVRPDPEDPLEENIAQLYKFHRKLHDNNARVWTILYAKADVAATS